jgi:hypothetical protein
MSIVVVSSFILLDLSPNSESVCYLVLLVHRPLLCSVLDRVPKDPNLCLTDPDPNFFGLRIFDRYLIRDWAQFFYA